MEPLESGLFSNDATPTLNPAALGTHTGGNEVRLLISRLTLSTALVLSVWAMLRIALIRYIRSNPHYDDALLMVVTDVEIHSLQPRLGYDLLAIPLFALFAFFVFRGSRLRESIAAYAVTSAIALMLAVGMACYPAGILGGHLGSRFSTSLSQSVAFAVTAVAGLLLISFLVRPSDRQGPPAKDKQNIPEMR